MKIAFVIQRYGLDINGGAELCCRLIAEHMRKYWDVEVLTTKAFDYITWKNHYLQDEEVINGIPVKRFKVKKKRHPGRFGRIQNYILGNEHKTEDEIRWLEEEGPFCPSLIRYIKEHKDNYDYFIFFCYRYYHSYWGINSVPDKSILVPTAEEDLVIHLNIFKDLFRKPQAIVYCSIEEKKMINSITSGMTVVNDVVGVGTEIPPKISVEEFRRKYKIEGDYVVYVGRVDENKGCDRLFDYFMRFKKETSSSIKLVLVGGTVLKIPSHSDIYYLGYLSEEDKFSAIEGALLLVMPSFYESLSMVTLEAWALKKAVLANACCKVLRGQCVRSNGGFFYENYGEFRESLKLLLMTPELCETIGRNGFEYFKKNYSWDVIEKKYLSVLDDLEKEKECKSISLQLP